MAIRARSMPLGEPIYTWVADDGTNVHIASERLRQWCIKRQPEIFLSPVDRDFAESFIKKNLVSTKRVLQLLIEIEEGKRKLDPIILCKRGTYQLNGGPDVFLVDGHHRYLLAAVVKQTYIPAYMLEPSQWRRFRVVGMPDFSQDELEAIPHRERHY